MINKLIEITFDNFWSFLGMMILINGTISIIIAGLVKSWSRFMRMLMIRKHGWPPNHLDADGDWRPLTKEPTVNETI